MYSRLLAWVLVTRLGMPIKFCDVTEYIISVLPSVELKVYWNSIRPIFTPH